MDMIMVTKILSMKPDRFHREGCQKSLLQEALKMEVMRHIPRWINPDQRNQNIGDIQKRTKVDLQIRKRKNRYITSLPWTDWFMDPPSGIVTMIPVVQGKTQDIDPGGN